MLARSYYLALEPPPLPLPVLAHGPRTCKISCRMYSCTGPQLLLACEWRDVYLETSVGYDTHRTSGTSNDASYVLLMPLTGSKTAFQHQMAAETERVNGNMADVTPGPGWKLLIHIGPFDTSL